MEHLSGNFLDYFAVFWAGVLVSFTPCVYPVLPVTAGLIAGANTQGTKLSGFWLSVVYVLGLAVTYCVLGVAAVLTRKAFGQFQQHPLVFLAIGNTLLVFALVMLDVIQLPFLGFNLRNKSKPRSLWTILLLGMAAGLIVGPCTAPILGTLLLYVASKENLLHAVSLLFVFSYGVGASLILVGTFSGALSVLPRSGMWLKRVQQVSALILLAAAEFFIIKAGLAWQ
ncbi:MAG: cytochrome c biogenesis protein CcdA [Candidatus Omnitrophota bacterium]|nr:cytochrome c biogenesis protein CcdA [Candidatus Omnitrophota bacterium]MDZ4242734.1 cytochrome c biogenesis protein CcdA [Candidatus Omnitrophota bacterium]